MKRSYGIEGVLAKPILSATGAANGGPCQSVALQKCASHACMTGCFLCLGYLALKVKKPPTPYAVGPAGLEATMGEPGMASGF